VAETAIEIDDLSRSFGAMRALDGISLSIGRGEVFGYLGPNGAGKTTTLRILVGTLQPTSGDARVFGASVTADPIAVKRTLGYVPESGAVFERLTPREFLEFTGRIRGLSTDETAARTEALAARFELATELDRRLGDLSKGTRQKACWCAALLHEPAVLVLDEPLSGLDVESVARVKELLAELSGSGVTVLYSSHLVDLVERMCHRVAVIHRGRLRAIGTPEEVAIGSGADTLEGAVRRLAAAGVA